MIAKQSVQPKRSTVQECIRKLTPIPLLLLACCIRCTDPSQTSKTERNDDTPGVRLVADEATEDALSRIKIGLSESELMEALKPKCINFGTVYWGGSGKRRVYFQIKPDKQIWFEVAGPSDGNKITEIGPIEPADAHLNRNRVWLGLR